MPTSAIEDQALRVLNAKDYVASFASTNTYAVIGRQIAWTNEALPDTATYYLHRLYEAWRESFGAKRLAAGDVANGTRRYDWVTGTVYVQYDAFDTLIHTKQFYIFTDENKVYKCLNNNGGVTSTVKPTATTATAAIVTADGYRWKYMYTLTSTDQVRFLSSSHVPLAIIAANNIPAGSVECYRIDAGGTGYSANFALIIEGDGTGAAATAVVAGGVITKVTVTTAGTGYTYMIISLANGAGTGGSIRANIAPPGGHGTNNIIELFGKFVIHSARFIFGEAGAVSTANDFRKISIIRNPLLADGVTPATAEAYRTSGYFTITSASGTFVLDEQITSGTLPTKYANVVEFDTAPTPDRLYVNNIRNTFVAANVITGGTSGVTGTIGTVVTPELKYHTGDLLFIEHRTPIQRAPDQSESFRIVFEF